MIKHVAPTLLCLFSIVTFSQVLPADRSVDWSLAGFSEFPVVGTHLNFVDEGGIGDGTTSNSAVISTLLSDYAGDTVAIFFPSGAFFFDSQISIPNNFILYGNGADSTILIFDLDGENLDLIRITGSAGVETATVLAGITKDENTCTVDDATDFEVGDWVQIIDEDSDWVTSAWSLGKTGQILRIADITEGVITFDSPFRRDYALENAPYINRLNMKRNVAVTDLKIVRQDATDGQTNNIGMRYARNCYVGCIESEMTNFAHVKLEFSSNCMVVGSYFHDGFDYGSGGKAYGVVCQFATGECLIQNNSFEHLRHSMLLQAGANGNVYAYNYSIDPYWTDVALPENSAGDMVLHGNYVYANLFEGNIVQNIVIDNSHGINGPYNTFFRNRADLYGLFMNSAPASNSQNFIGNEITNSGFLLGMYVLEGTDHFEYGNNHQGDVVPEGTEDLSDESYYLDEGPIYYTSQDIWPPIGYPNALDANQNRVSENYAEGYPVFCLAPPYVDDIGIEQETKAELLVYPNPVNELLYISYAGGDYATQNVAIYNEVGELVHQQNLTGNTTSINTEHLAAGVYIVKLISATDKLVETKFIKL